MKLVIDIDERYYEIVKREVEAKRWDFIPCTLIANGTPLPKGHGRLKDIDAFIAKVQADRQHAIYTRSWTADDVLDALSGSYTPTIIEADGEVQDAASD